MNDAIFHKNIIQCTWLFEAIATQYRSLFGDIKKSNSVALYNYSLVFKTFQKYMQIACALLKQAKYNHTMQIKNTSVSAKSLSNNYNLYFKRSFIQLTNANDLLKKLGYDHDFQNDFVIKNIFVKMNSLISFYNQLDSVLYKLVNLS